MATVAPLPEMLHRHDVEGGEWTIGECNAVRGEPHTNIIDRQMVVPTTNDEKSRIIRAHEMAHAKFSPAHDFPKWVERGVASDTALRAVEEVRVNYLIGRAGFDTKQLSDGSELASGERCAQSGDWSSAVFTAVAYACSGGINQFITGVRRHNKEWATALRELTRKVEKEMERAHKNGNLTSTEVCNVTGLSPRGFFEVERLAQWVDGIAFPPIEEDDEDEEPTEGEAGDEAPAPVSTEGIKRSRPARGSVDRAHWAKMSVVKCQMPRRTRGGIGKKRKATNVGTNPRRISRLLTDPEKRVFDSTKKGMGGVVLIDGSGSMHLTTADIMSITEASAGCTVAVYSTFAGNRDGGRLFIVAENGRMVEDVDSHSRGAGNGCDGPALRWAIKQAGRGEPVVWVCDGIVTAWDDQQHEKLTIECANLMRRNNVWMASDVENAVKVLATLKRGSKPKRWVAPPLLSAERRVAGL